MKNEIYDDMLSAYDRSTEQKRRNAIFEVNQQVILAGLYNGGFFDVAAFYGGVYDVYFQTDKSIKIKIEVDTRPPMQFSTEQKLLLQPHSFMTRCFALPLDFTHLAERVRQFNHEEISKDAFIGQLKDKLSSANINQVKSDVLPFVRNPKELNIWSNDYFVQLADMIKFE